jgi:hypothetical protein
VRFAHGPEELVELLVHRAREVAAALGGQHVHQAALDAPLLALGSLEPVYGLVELPAALVDHPGELFDLGVVHVALRPRFVPGGAGRLVRVLGPDDRPLLLLAF